MGAAVGGPGSEGYKGKVLRMDRPLAGGFLSLTGPLAPRVVDCPMGNEFYNAAFGGQVQIKYHNQDYHRPPLRHFVALFP